MPAGKLGRLRLECDDGRIEGTSALGCDSIMVAARRANTWTGLVGYLSFQGVHDTDMKRSIHDEQAPVTTCVH